MIVRDGKGATAYDQGKHSSGGTARPAFPYPRCPEPSPSPTWCSLRLVTRVMTAAEKLDYSVSRSAAALKSGQSFRIALLASETITTWFNANIFAGLDSVLRPCWL